MSTDNTEQALPDYIPMDHEAMTSIHLPGDVISDTKARQQYARNVERKAVDHYKAQLRAALTAAPPAQPQEPALRHCRGCGEGVTSFCRAPRSEGECLMGLPMPGRAAPPRAVEPLTDEHAWISVDDKLPETPDDGSDVPVYVWDGKLVSEDDYAEQWEQPAGPMVGGWIQTGWDFMSNSRLGKPQVTHWCHRRAPKPPQD